MRDASYPLDHTGPPKLARWPWNLQRRSQSSPTRPVSGWNRHAAATATGSSTAAENGYGIHSMAMKNRSSGWSNWEVCSCKTLQKTKSWQRTKFIWIYMGLCSLVISSMAKLVISQNNIAMDSDKISVRPSFPPPRQRLKLQGSHEPRYIAGKLPQHHWNPWRHVPSPSQPTAHCTRSSQSPAVTMRWWLLPTWKGGHLARIHQF